MAVVQGKNFMAYMYRNGTKLPICYAENVSLNINGELIEATKPITTNWRSHNIGMLDYDLSADGVVVDDESETFNIMSMQQMIIARTVVPWICQDDTNPLVFYSGKVVFTNVGEDSPAADFNRFTLAAKGDGELSIGPIIPGQTGRVYFGVQLNGDDPDNFDNYIETDPNIDITIPYGVAEPGYYWMAHSVNGVQKTNYRDLSDPQNAGMIGGTDNLFRTSIITIGSEQFVLYMVNYATLFGGTNQQVFFYKEIPANPVLPPTNVGTTLTIPGDGYGHILITWDASGTPDPKNYTVRIIDITAGFTQYIDIDGATSLEYLTGTLGNTYLISVRTNTPAPDNSEWTDNITVVIPPPVVKIDVSLTPSAIFKFFIASLNRKITVTASINVDVLITIVVRAKPNVFASQDYTIQIPAGQNTGVYQQGNINAGSDFGVESIEILSVTPSSSNTQNYVY